MTIMSGRFDGIPERDGRTDTDEQMDGRTDRIAISISRVGVLTRDQNQIMRLTVGGCEHSFNCVLFIYVIDGEQMSVFM